jgi:hypothetical protein
MIFDDGGAVVKRCGMCGKRLRIEDWYAAMSTKYCPSCAKEQHRITNANCMAEARRKARERRKLEREQQRLTADENELLRAQVIQLRARVENLQREIDNEKSG